MSLPLPFTSDPLAYDTRVELDRVYYVFEVRWNWRTADWRLTVRVEATGEVIAASRRISPGTMCVKLPAGELHAFGEDPYTEDSLGQALQVRYYTDAEIEELARAAALASDPVFALV